MELKAGTLTGNTNTFENYTTQAGGAVIVYSDASFIMSGGIISGNTADVGGGVNVNNSSAKFTKTGGTIYGSNAGANSNKATAGNTWGHAVVYSYNSSTYYYCDETLGPNDKVSTNNLNNGWKKR